MSTTYPDGLAAASALRLFIEAQLETNHGADFATWGGTVSVTQDEERLLQDVRPRLVFSVQDERGSRLFELPAARDLVLSVEAKANDASGAIPPAGTEGPDRSLSTSDSLLSQVLAQMLDEEREEVREQMREMGFYHVIFMSQREVTRENRDALPTQVDPHRISLTYLRG